MLKQITLLNNKHVVPTNEYGYSTKKAASLNYFKVKMLYKKQRTQLLKALNVQCYKDSNYQNVDFEMYMDFYYGNEQNILPQHLTEYMLQYIGPQNIVKHYSNYNKYFNYKLSFNPNTCKWAISNLNNVSEQELQIIQNVLNTTFK